MGLRGIELNNGAMQVALFYGIATTSDLELLLT
jgi:hypothetical protein